MLINTNVSRAITATESNPALDASVKELLADKQILAVIIKYTLEEFADTEIKDIIPCIGDDIEIGTVALDPGLTNLGKVNESKTEDKVPNEGYITFDIRFTLLLSRGEEILLKMLINVEGQGTSTQKDLGYHLDNRIVFYLARMISAQKETEFFRSNYDDIKPVRSIWICLDAGEDEDSIEEISLNKRTVFGKNKGEQDDKVLDLVLAKGIIVNIRLGKHKAESQNKLIAMLETLLSETDGEKKKEKLARDYGMVMTQETGRRLDDMDISVALMNAWKRNAIEEAREEVLEEGIERGTVMGAIDMLRDMNIPEAEIATRIKEKYKLTDEELDKYLGVTA